MSKAPAPYQPPNQAGAAAAFQAGADKLGQQGAELYNTVSPEYQRIYDSVKNNPYYAQAMQGVQQAAGQATSVVAPQQFAGAAQNAGIAGMAAAAAPVAANAAYQGGQQGYQQSQASIAQGRAGLGLIPQATAGMNYAPQVASYLMGQIPGLTQAGIDAAPGVLSNGLSRANQVADAATAAGQQSYANAQTSWDQSQGALHDVQSWNTPFMAAAGQTLNTGFDPQKALYNRSFQQNAEQSNAINAQNGVVGSPFAAGVASDQARNFNIDWDNAQLQRQIQALGAYGTAEGAATGAVNNTMTTGANNYATLSGDARGWADSGASNYGNLVNSATGSYANLTNSAANNIAGLTNSAVSNFNSLNNSAVSNFNDLNNSAAQNTDRAINTGSNVLNAGINTGVGALSTLGDTTFKGNEAASDLNRAGLNTLTTASAAPSTVYQQQQQAQLSALNQQVQGTNAASAQQQTSVGDQGDYLKIGQTANQGAQNAAAQNNKLIGDVLSGVSTIASMIPW